MNIKDLADRLHEEGCTGFSLQASISDGAGYDAMCLECTAGDWTVFYTERGTDSAPIYRSSSESDACEFFLDYMKKEPNRHCVGIFQSEESAEALEAQLRALSIDPIRNDIPVFTINGDPCFRVFVAGKQIHVVRGQFESIPLRD